MAGLWCYMIFIQRVLCFLFPSFGKRIENTQWVGCKSYHITDHGIFFSSHIYHPIPVFVDFILRRAWRYTMWYIKKLSHEWYRIDIKDWLFIVLCPAQEVLQNVGQCLALRAFEQGGIFIVPHLLWHGTSVFPVSSEGLPHSVAYYNTQGMWIIYSNPDPHRSWYKEIMWHKYKIRHHKESQKYSNICMYHYIRYHKEFEYSAI
jgi:hypothetical protein